MEPSIGPAISEIDPAWLRYAEFSRVRLCPDCRDFVMGCCPWRLVNPANAAATPQSRCRDGRADRAIGVSSLEQRQTCRLSG